ncbi:cysteine peptidase family C39 domain-containing protein [Mycoplasma mycoides]|uniref:cysteine peptidase family C39 domain-containing protein n=1 Tax=Mycoplasma mycoides TaxID=2102 RepID=UPI0003070AD9|nr:cysteine peptidase family C39 domain-containing protein [Mycoplasma mycoides]AMW76479.1 peptidase, C39 family [synthetic bacterium JCVI-Syn3.0]AMW76941.1 peptidase, C39 family [synthetic bacterium JCVI-Syn2.0]SRX62067.1 peptidase C39 [Mycoplasma mycoides subsp. capri]SRX63741.1 peptidase C39 [Mycoplasma mycoides subsp. capri]SRX67786.1 peptidase C39 [Mycoplasma mycoides subsp. capri]
MIINYYYNQNYDLDRLKLEINYVEEMLSFYDISNICSKYFLTCKALQIENDLEQINKKVYLAQVVNQTGLLHFVVVEKQNNHLIIYDPLKTKKQKFTYKDFYQIFTGYILIFNSNYKKFKANYNNLFTLFDSFYLAYLFYIILNIFSILLTILEMRFLYVYSLSITNLNNSYFLYLYFLAIFIINIFLNEISKFLLNKYYQKNKSKKLETFYYYLVEKNIKLDIINTYSEIEFISSYQTYVLLNTISAVINSLVILFVIFYINKTIFLVLFVFDLFWLVISFIYNFFTNQNKTNNQNLNLITHLLNKTKLIDKKTSLELIKKDLNKTQTDYLHILFNFFEKISLLVIYYISWDLLKFNYIEFSILLIIVLFKAIHTNDLKKLVYFLQNFNKYKQLLIKFNNFKLANNYIELEQINNIQIRNLLTNLDINLDQKINYLSNEYDLKTFIKTKNSNDHILILINKINLKDISTFSLNKHFIHLDNLEIKYSTILQNIIINQSDLNIFTHKIIKDLINKYQINLTKIINLETITKLETEFIKLLRIFYLDHHYLLFNDNFEIINKTDISLVLKLFTSYSNSSLIITSNDIKYNLISKD